jgi:CheY-like chemotaxis protein
MNNLNLKNMNILIVEDDVDYANILKLWLSKSVTTIDVVTRSEAGIAYLSTKKPDIIFLDNALPSLNGNEVLRAYKVLSPRSHLILMSGYLNDDIVAELIRKGADEVLDKNKADKEQVLKIIETVVNFKRN